MSDVGAGLRYSATDLALALGLPHAPTREQAQCELEAAVAAIPELGARAGSVILGSPDEVRAVYERILATGVDGFTINLPANGHIPGRVALLGETLAPLIG